MSLNPGIAVWTLLSVSAWGECMFVGKHWLCDELVTCPWCTPHLAWKISMCKKKVHIIIYLFILNYFPTLHSTLFCQPVSGCLVTLQACYSISKLPIVSLSHRVCVQIQQRSPSRALNHSEDLFLLLNTFLFRKRHPGRKEGIKSKFLAPLRPSAESGCDWL